MRSEIIIFGTGKRIEEEIQVILSNGYSVKYFVDNNISKQGNEYNGREIKSPLELLNEPGGQLIVVSSEQYKEEIFQQLKDLGVYYSNECIGIDDFEYRILRDNYKKPSTNKTNMQAKGFSILYDSQIFSMQKQGGISRYYYEIIDRISRKDNISVNLFQGVNNSSYDFSHMQDRLLNYYSRKTDYINHWVYDSINASLIGEFTDCADSLYIYHPTYYAEYGVKNYKHLIVTVYDMIHELYHLDKWTILRKERILKKADGIIAISENTKQDLIKIYGIDERKIKVIYLANSLNNSVDEKRIIEKPYILFVGNRSGYKNAKMLMEAFSQSRCKKEMKLVFMGGGAFSQQERQLFEDLHISDQVYHFSGDDVMLANLYNYAECFVYPSLYEGFGLPILESMHYGTPVITSNTSSMKEVAGDAALLFDSDSVEDLILSLDRLAEDGSLRDELMKKGFEKEKEFSWDKCANETYDYYCSFV